jgi:hypothetical protein
LDFPPGGQLHSDVTAERRADPIDLLHAEVRDKGTHDREIEWSAVVLRVLDRCTPPTPGKIGRHDSHPEFGESLRKKVKVATVAREPVRADHRSFGIFGSPCRVAHLRKAMRAQRHELPKRGLSGAPTG